MNVSGSDEEIVIVSDLHLSGATRTDASVGRRADAFASFVRWLAANGRAGMSRRLVLLGDSLDLPTHVSGSSADATLRWQGAATAALDRIADANPAPFDALAAYTAAGGRIELLPGNHDVALQLPVVREALLDRLGGGSAAVGWHPWILHLPGLLWAEHGSQHHDLHAIPEWLSPPARRSTWGLPAGRAIEALSVTAGQRRAPGRLLAAGSAAVAADAIASAFARPALASRRRAYRTRELPSLAAATGLPEAMLVAIDRSSETDGWSIAWRLIQRRFAGGDRSPASFLGPAASRIHAILAAAGRDVRVYAFGHTHTPAILPIGPSAADASYANPGTWAGARPDAVSAEIGPDRYPFLRIMAAADDEPTVELRLWNAAARRVDAFPG
jgi:UDP-2,3-diacylglucosamine pyrophosphatase LpxH